jgi:transcription termination/antitermination protein NusG
MTTKAKTSKNLVANNPISHNDQEDFILLDSGKPRWYVLQTYVGFEDAARKIIEQKIENLSLQDKIIEIYIPTQKVIKINSKGERKEKDEKIYPGYVYLNMILDKETGYVLQNTAYVSRIASTGNVAVPLEEGYIETLKGKLLKDSSDVKTSTSSIKYHIGDLVDVIDGPFQHMHGKISSIDPHNNKITVLLSIFERDTEVVLDILKVEKRIV